MKKQDTRMVDVTDKKDTQKLAVARATIMMQAATFDLIRKGEIPKGDVPAVAQTSGIMAAKKTSDVLPLCHPLLLTGVAVDFSFPKQGSCIEITTTVKGRGKTGFEMEAFTVATVSALTIYDMCKIVDKNMSIGDIKLLKKTGGKSGTCIAK